MFSTGILGLLNIEKSYWLLIILGSIFSIIILFLYLLLNIKKENTTIEIEGLVIYNTDNNRLIDIPEYDIAHDMINYLSSAFSEHKALESKWKIGKLEKLESILK